MKYVRLKFSEEEYEKIKKQSDGSNLPIHRFIHSKILKMRREPFYFYNLIIVLLEEIAEDVKNNKYNENTSKIFFYLYTIEQILQKKL